MWFECGLDITKFRVLNRVNILHTIVRWSGEMYDVRRNSKSASLWFSYRKRKFHKYLFYASRAKLSCSSLSTFYSFSLVHTFMQKKEKFQFLINFFIWDAEFPIFLHDKQCPYNSLVWFDMIRHAKWRNL